MAPEGLYQHVSLLPSICVAFVVLLCYTYILLLYIDRSIDQDNMAANRNSRYYSQSYEAVDNPANPSQLGHPETAHQPDGGEYQDYETYRGFKTVSDLDIAEPGNDLPPRQSKRNSRKKLYIIIAIAACVVIGLAVGLANTRDIGGPFLEASFMEADHFIELRLRRYTVTVNFFFEVAWAKFA